MDNRTENLVNDILASYQKHELTSKHDSDNLLSKSALIDVLEELRRVLFPGFFNHDTVNPDYVRFDIGKRLEYIHYQLKKQISKALGSEKHCQKCENSKITQQADDIVMEFLSRIPAIRDYLATDIEAAYNGDPAAYSTDEIIFCYPGVFAITVYRIAHELWNLGVPMIPRIFTEHAHSITGIDIHPGATIGKYFFIDHGTGIVIGETTIIGENVKIYQGVTLGALSTRKGQELKGTKRHPTLGDKVTIYSGTTVLGGETVIGDGATIGGNAFIVSSVAPGMKVSVKNPELQFSQGTKTELTNKGFTDWII